MLTICPTRFCRGKAGMARALLLMVGLASPVSVYAGKKKKKRETDDREDLPNARRIEKRTGASHDRQRPKKISRARSETETPRCPESPSL